MGRRHVVNLEIETHLRKIWCATLSVSEVRAEDSVYIARGDSKAVDTVVARVRRELNIDFDAGPLLAQPTFGMLLSIVSAVLTNSSVAHGTAHQRVTAQAERAMHTLLGFRPFHGVPLKPTLALAEVLSNPESELPPEVKDTLFLVKFLKEIAT
jgi:hypothetical protein